MKKFNVLLACLFMIVPFFGSAQKNLNSVLTAQVGGGDSEASTQQFIGVIVSFNNITEDGGAYTLPNEGEPYAEPTYLILEEKATEEIISTILLNGKTFSPNSTSPECSTVSRGFIFSLFTNECPSDIPEGEIYLDEYVVRLSNADSYEDPTNFYLSNSHYVRSLIGMNQNNPNTCVFYDKINISYEITCGAPTGQNFISNLNTNDLVKIDDNLQKNKHDDELGISVFPNPFRESIKIDNLVSDEPVTIKIFDSRGKVVKNIFLSATESREQSILTSDWAAGFYIVRIETKSKSQIYKLLKF